MNLHIKAYTGLPEMAPSGTRLLKPRTRSSRALRKRKRLRLQARLYGGGCVGAIVRHNTFCIPTTWGVRAYCKRFVCGGRFQARGQRRSAGADCWHRKVGVPDFAVYAVVATNAAAINFMARVPKSASSRMVMKDAYTILSCIILNIT